MFTIQIFQVSGRTIHAATTPTAPIVPRIGEYVIDTWGNDLIVLSVGYRYQDQQTFITVKVSE